LWRAGIAKGIFGIFRGIPNFYINKIKLYRYIEICTAKIADRQITINVMAK
jgi:hypothetical protein